MFADLLLLLLCFSECKVKDGCHKNTKNPVFSLTVVATSTTICDKHRKGVIYFVVRTLFLLWHHHDLDVVATTQNHVLQEVAHIGKCHSLNG